MFLEPTERIIVMEDDLYFPFDIEDLKKIESADIKTIMIPHQIYADKSPLDSKINFVLRNTNLKILLPFFYETVERPMTYYIEHERDIDAYLAALRLTFYADRDKIQFIYAIPQGGEFLWDAMMTENYPISDQRIAEFIIGRQRLLAEQHGEIYLCLHNNLGHHNNWNNIHLPYLYAVLSEEFDIPIYSFQFAHFSCGGTEMPKAMQMKVKQYKDEYGIKFFVGSDYCEGLIRNYADALEQEVYGFITAPLHSENPNRHEHIKEWMVSALRGANEGLYDSHTLES